MRLPSRTLRAFSLLATALLVLVNGCQYFGTDGQINYGLNHYKMGLHAQAVPALMSAAQTLEKRNPADPRLSRVLLALADMAEMDRRPDLAENFYKRALKAVKASAHPEDAKLRNVLVPMGLFLNDQRRPAEALPLLQQAAQISKDFADKILYAIDLDNLSVATCALGSPSEAASFSRQALQVLDAVTPSGYEKKTRAIVLYNLAYAMLTQGKDKEAEPLLAESLRILETGGATDVEPSRVRFIRNKYVAVQNSLHHAVVEPNMSPDSATRK